MAEKYKPSGPSYTEYPLDQRRSKVSVESVSGEIESGWLPAGEGVSEDGTPFTRVVKLSDKDVLQEDIPTDKLSALNDRLAAERLARSGQREEVAVATGHVVLQQADDDPFSYARPRSEIMQEAEAQRREDLRRQWGPRE